MKVQVSVVVPTCQRDELLNRCLSALTGQDLDPAAYEVIVAGDGGGDDTAKLVASWSERAQPAIRYVRTRKTSGPAAARNVGWRIARADIIAFTDDDCAPDPHWLKAGIRALESGAHAAWGRLIVPLTDLPTDYERDAARLERAEFVTANCFYRRSALERLGGFDERFTAAWREDSDLFFSLIERNGKFVHAPGAVVVHPVRPAPWGVSLTQQKKNVFNALLYKKHPSLYVDRVQPQPPWRYYAAVLSLSLTLSAAAAGRAELAVAASSLWLYVTARFCEQRLRGASRSLSHIFEMLVTSVLIPPLAVYWRLRGAIRYKVVFL